MQRQPRISSTPAVTRRRALALGGATMTALLAPACDLSTEPTTGRDGPDDRGSKGREAPILARRVKAGELPPVEERLPANPTVVEPVEKVGLYGGTWLGSMTGPDDKSYLDRCIGYEYLLRWKPDTVAFALDEIVPDAAESYEVDDEGTVYTFYLREGMKWSDGEPFTADDIVFAVEDVLYNEELYPTPPIALIAGGEPMRVEKVDDHTVRFLLAEPSILFPHNVASKNRGLRELTGCPRHYLEQFHKAYNPDIQQLVQDEGAPDWIELFSVKKDPWNNVELPRIHAWVPTNALNEGSRAAFERNPFYWKVDPDGSQLPYLDRVVFDFLDQEVRLLKVTNGEIDLMESQINTLPNKPVFAAQREASGYHFIDLSSDEINTGVISVNLAHRNPVKREVFRNKDFRIGLSHAINRQEIIDAVYQGQGEPWQASAHPDSDYFDEELATQYLEYDVDLANEYLDKAGFSDRDDNGIRLGPDGKPISFSVDVSTQHYGFDWPAVLELVKTYWREVGVDMHIKAVDWGLYGTRKDANEHDAAIIAGDGGARCPHFYPRQLFPYNHRSEYAVPWATWYASNGTNGEEPPERVKEQMALYDEYQKTTDEGAQADLMRQITEIAKEQFYAIGISRPVDKYGTVKNNFHNVPKRYLESSEYPNPGPVNPAQFFKS